MKYRYELSEDQFGSFSNHPKAKTHQNRWFSSYHNPNTIILCRGVICYNSTHAKSVGFFPPILIP